MPIKQIKKIQCPVCSHNLRTSETDILENHESWCIVETACQYCGSMSLGLMIGQGKNSSPIKLLSDISKNRNFRKKDDDEYCFDYISKEKQWAES